MNLYRTSESGLVAVQSREPGETSGLAEALLRGPGGALGAADVLFVTTAVGDGTATAVALDAEGDVVVVGAADGEVGSEVVTDALQRASAVADSSYDALEARYEGDGSLREAHADFFDREALAPEVFNQDQRVRLVGPAFAGDAIDLARFLSDRDVAVDPVRVEAFGAPTSDEYLVRFEAVEGDEEATEGTAVDADGAEQAEDSDQWVAGTSATAAASTTGDEGEETDGGAVAASHESALTDAEESSVEAEEDEPDDVSDAVDAGDTEEPPADEGDQETDEAIDLPVLLEAVAEGIQERLVGTFDADPADVVSVERGNEVLVRPDHPAYAGGVLRYRLRANTDGTVEFEVNIYGGSEAEKEQMRALVREHEAAIEEELGYEVAERYDGFAASREFSSYDQVAAAEIVDEFDRLVRFFNPRVMRA